MLDRKDLLDGLFDGPDAVGAFEVRDYPPPEGQLVRVSPPEGQFVRVSVCCDGVHE